MAMATTVVEQLRLSVGALSAERRRLEDEVMKLEQKQKMTATDMDDMVRRLKAEIDAVDAEQAKKRQVLARAEAQRQTLARDRAEAQTKAHQEAVAQCQARLAALLDRELELVAHLERLAREALDARKELLAVNADARAEAGRLDKASAVGSDADLIKRLSLKEAKVMAQLAGCRFRYGHLELPANAFGLVPDGLTWPEDEARYQRDVRALIEEVN
jgi:chromosome segregation ATPase